MSQTKQRRTTLIFGIFKVATTTLILIFLIGVNMPASAAQPPQNSANPASGVNGTSKASGTRPPILWDYSGIGFKNLLQFSRNVLALANQNFVSTSVGTNEVAAAKQGVASLAAFLSGDSAPLITSSPSLTTPVPSAEPPVVSPAEPRFTSTPNLVRGFTRPAITTDKEFINQILQSSKSVLAPFTQDFLEPRERLVFPPIGGPPTGGQPLVSQNLKNLIKELARKITDIDIAKLFSPKELGGIQQELTDLQKKEVIDEKTLDALTERISERLPKTPQATSPSVSSGQTPQTGQTIKETRVVEKETRVVETKIVTNEEKINELTTLLDQLKKQQVKDRQDLFNAIALTNRINTIPSNTTINNVTITNPSFANEAITDAMVIDTITASNYLPLGGGTLTGNLLTNSSVSLGISTTTPSQLLSVQGNALISGTTTVGVLHATSTVKVGTSSPIVGFGSGLQITKGFLESTGGGATTFLALTDTQSSFTANRIIHTDSGATALTDTAGFVFDGTSLGIGTTTPSQLLSVQGNALIAGTTTLSGFTATGSVLLATAGNRVGIGTLSPATILHLSTANQGEIARFEGTGASSFVKIGVPAGNNVASLQFDVGIASTPDAEIGFDPTNSLGFFVNLDGTRKLIISQTTGLVGISTTTPGALLAVQGRIITEEDLYTGNLTATGTALLATKEGSLGISTTTPSQLLSVQGNALISGTTTVGVLHATSTVKVGTSSPIVGFGSGLQITKGFLESTGGGATTFLALTDTQSSFTANRIIHTDSGATALTDTAGFVFDGTSLGIGTTTPSQLLSVQGNALISGTTTLNALYATGTIIFRSGVNSTNYFKIQDTDGGAPVLAVDTVNERVGIGTAAPTESLEVYTSNSTNLYMIVRNDTGSSAGIKFKNTNTGGDWTHYVNSSGNLTIYGGNPLATRMTIKTNGNIGIGAVDNPLQALHVVGSQILTGDLDIYGADINLGTGLATTTLTSASGNLGISTTTPSQLLSVQGNALISGTTTVQGLIATSTLYVGSLGSPNFIVTPNVSGGMIGIGTTTPSQLLSVQGNALISGTTTVGGLNATGTVNLALASETSVGIGTSGANIVGKLDIRGDEVRIWTGAGTNDQARASGELYVEGDFEVDGNSYLDEAFIPTTLSVASTSQFSVTARRVSIHGDTLIAGTTTVQHLIATGTSYVYGAGGQADFKVYNGSVCADNNGGSKCQAELTAGTVYGDTGTFAASDLAENYPISDDSIEEGDIVALSNAVSFTQQEEKARFEAKGQIKDKNQEDSQSLAELLKTTLIKATPETQNKIIGAISTNPGVLLGDTTGMTLNTKTKPVALSGRIPVKVNLEGGSIQSGDPITVSSVPGVGKKAAQSGRIIGYALENYNGPTPENNGKVLVFTSLGYWIGPDLPNQQLTTNNQQLTTNNHNLVALIIDTVKGWLESLKVFVEDGLVRLKELAADAISAKKLCLEDVCIEKIQLKALLDNANLNSAATATQQSVTQETQSPNNPTNPSSPVDAEPPVITLNGFNSIEIEIGVSWVDPGATVTDNVNDNLGIYYKIDGIKTGNGGRALPQIDTSVAGTHIIIYTAIDAAGNTTSVERTITVIDPNPSTGSGQGAATASDSATTTPSVAGDN